ncbi:peroxisomal testis-specific protein 1 [Prionailurus iriomotensis]
MGRETYSGHLQKAVVADHNLPSQPKESSIGQNHHQEEIIHKLAMQLRNIGDSIDRGMVQERSSSAGSQGGTGSLCLGFLWRSSRTAALSLEYPLDVKEM